MARIRTCIISFMLCLMMFPRTSLALHTKFILVGTHHSGNVGAAARALKTMCFDQLVLVTPRDPKVLRRERTKQAASGAMDVMERCVIVPTLTEALEGVEIKCGTGMPTDMSIERKVVQEFAEPRRYFARILENDGGKDTNNDESIESIAFVFGNEKFGMTPEDMALCDVMLGIPTNPSFGSLNLASAVQLIAYDWRQALGGFENHHAT